MKYIVIFAALLLSGCSGSMYVLLFNNSASSVTVAIGSEVVVLQPQEQHTFNIGMAGTRPILVTTANVERVYRYNDVPGKYYETGYNGLSYRVHLQLQPNLSVVTIAPDLSLPAQSIPKQPEGYPLEPLPDAL